MELNTETLPSPPSGRPPFIIPPAKRFQFIILFTVLTGLCWSVRYKVASLVAGRITGTSFEEGLVIGLIIGIAQWFVLHRYIPNKSWIAATSLGWAISLAIYSRLSLNMNVDRWVSSVAFICLGFAQWLVLHQDIKYSWIWILIPFLPVLLTDVLDAILLPKPSTPLDSIYWEKLSRVNASVDIIRRVFIGAIPAISLCLFRKKN